MLLLIVTTVRSLSKFYTIKYYNRNTIGQTGLNNFAMLAIKHKKQAKHTLKNIIEIIFKISELN
jgi:hypothetical protein